MVAKIQALSVAAGIALAALCGCGGDDDSSPASDGAVRTDSSGGGACPTTRGVLGSCNFGAQCANYVGTPPTPAVCPAPGVLSTQPCPAANAAGCCYTGQGTQIEGETVFYRPTFSNTSGAERDCASSGGTWRTP